jgi:hypothetical protein
MSVCWIYSPRSRRSRLESFLRMGVAMGIISLRGRTTFGQSGPSQIVPGWRIDSADLLPVRGRCLTKMLPVQTWHEREQEAEPIEFGDQARVGLFGGGEVRVVNAG